MKAKIATAVLFVCAAIIIVWLLLIVPRDNRVAPLVALACAVGFFVVTGAMFFAPRLSYFAAMISGMVALCWFSRIEFWDFPPINSWILLNLPDGDPSIFIARLRILFVAAVVTSTACSLTRILPSNWTLRGIPIRSRTWPAFAVCFVVIVSWYVASASPYRVPYIVDAVTPDLAILHIQKSGLQFHEVAITAYRDGRFYARRNDRRWFRYRFAVLSVQGVMPEAVTTRVRALAESLQSSNLRTLPAHTLRNQTAEGWYIRTRQGVLAFTTEYGTQPPGEVVSLFRDLESIPQAEQALGTQKDVCLGFCYDPLAGLGFLYLNERCREQNGTRCK